MKVCAFCGSESPDSVTTCPSCGANEFRHKCENCGATFNEGNFCPNCGVKVGTKAKKCPMCGKEYFSAACPDCGYMNNLDIAESGDSSTTVHPQKKKRLWLWVLGWIFIFPVPLTILIVRNQKLNRWAKIGIIAATWILYLAIGLIGGDTPNNLEISDDSQAMVNTEMNVNDSNITEKRDAPSKESTIDNLVNGFNAVSENKLEYVGDFVVSSEDSGHYRTEFRLGAYKDAVGKSYKFGDQIVDIISRQSLYGDIDVRIYTDNASFDQCKELILYASKILDPTMTDDTLNDAIAYVENNKKANGYYYGELGLTLFGSDLKGYDLMIKTD